MTIPAGVHEVAVGDDVAATVDDVEVTGPSGSVRIPTFRGADGVRRARFRAVLPGEYRVTADGAEVASVTVDAAGATSAAPHLTRRGRHFTDDGGQPFLWLADTWWYALSGRLELDELRALAAQRVGEGFNVVQLVAGLLPEVYTFDPLGDLDGRWPWTRDLADIDPAWWDAADERMTAIVEAGLVPAVAGAWSYYLADLGRERLERHWREIVARWSALPVVWCIAGEAGLPHYEELGTDTIDQQVAELTSEWAKVVHYVRGIDPYQNLRTIHPCPAFEHYSSTDLMGGKVEDIDLIWLQTGHADRSAIPSSLDTVDRELADAHGLPVVNSEVCYEGIAAGSGATLQRFLFWSHMLSGTAGHSYGAQGIWAFRRSQDPGPGLPWGDATWQEAATLPGARQLGAGAALLRGLDWSALVPSPETLSVHASPAQREFPYAARSADRVVAYFPAASLLPLGIGISQDLSKVTVQGLEPGEWDFAWWNPRSGEQLERRTVTIDASGAQLLGNERWPVNSIPSMEDWVFVALRVR